MRNALPSSHWLNASLGKSATDTDDDDEDDDDDEGDDNDDESNDEQPEDDADEDCVAVDEAGVVAEFKALFARLFQPANVCCCCRCACALTRCR